VVTVVRSTAMLAELVSVPTASVALDGLWYEPPAPLSRRGVAMLMHGNGANFYSGPVRFLTRHVLDTGMACFPYNRRGHETLTTRTRKPEGNAYQTAAEAMADNEAARRYVAERGERHPVLIGHSNGGLYAAQHTADHPGVRALVLLSAHCGGPEMLRRASALGLLAGPHQASLSDQARVMVENGHPDDLMLLPGWWYVTSARSFLDMEQNLPRLLTAAERITCPVLYVRGGLEDPDLYPAEGFAERAGGHVDIRIVPGADHFYSGCEEQVGTLVAEWLTTILGT